MHLPHRRIALVALAVSMLAGTARADSWPTYLHDNARSGMTLESFDLPLKLSPSKGLPLFRKIVPKALAYEQQLLAALSEDELQRFSRLVQKLQASAEAVNKQN